MTKVNNSVDELLRVTKQLAEGEPEIGATLLMIAAAVLCRNKRTYDEHCRSAWNLSKERKA